MGLFRWIKERRRRKEEAKEIEMKRLAEKEQETHIAECLATENPHVYSMGGYWGHHIDWFGDNSPDDGKVYGHLPRLPELGDIVEVTMESGRVMEYRFIEVRYCADPRDMFFGTLRPAVLKDDPNALVVCPECKKTWVSSMWDKDACPGCAFNRIMAKTA